MRTPLLAAALLVPTGLLAQDSGSDGDADLPLQPDRTLAIDMTVGSWISLDVSPDGQTIVFDHLGDLFTVPITGGDATQLTSGMAFDAQPRFSPDGTRIVFTSDRSGGQNVWIMSLDGSDTTQVTTGGANRTESPDWAPDGEYVVSSKGGFRGGGLPKLWLHHVDGGSGVQLIDEPDNLKTLGAAFDPTGRYIWHARRTGDWTYNAQFPQYQLAVYDRETGETYTRTSRYGSGIRPTPSPDGRWLVYGTRHDARTGLIIRDLESGAERWLAYPVQHDDQESRGTLDVLPGMSFTPDSRHLVASYGGRIWKLDVVDGGAEQIPFRVQYDLELGPLVEFDYPIEDTPTFTVRQIRDAVPSPDGSRIAFTALDRLWVANADGTEPRRLTADEHSEHYPAWSPDGDWIAYATWDGEAGHLHKVRAADGDSPVRLTERGAVYITPAWSPAGDRIVALRSFARDFQESAGGFGSGAPQPGEIVWVADGDGPGAATLIAPVDGRRGPHFTAGSGDRIHFQSGQDMLVSIRWDGTDEREHVRIRGATPPGSQNALTPSVLRMAPQGDQVMALIEGQIYTATVPMVGGEAPLINVGNPSRAAMPARRLTDMGGEFPVWAASGRAVHWSLGRAFFTYDLDAAEAFEEAQEAEEAAEAKEEEEEGEEGDDPDEDDDGYTPVEVWIDIQAERDTPRGTALLSGARVVTVAGAGTIERGDILVRHNRIAAVGPSGSLDVPSDARVIDVSGKTIVPGFVDTHAHMRPARNLHRADVWPYLANLAYGVTTTRDPQTGTTDVLSYADLVRTGDLVGPRVYSTGPGVFWQHMIDSEDEARDIMSKYANYFDTKTIKMYVAGNRQQRQWIIMAARELGLMPTTEGSLNLRQNLNETIDGYPGLEHSIPIYPVYDDYVRVFVATKRAYSPTLLVSYGGPWAENYFFSRENPHDDEKLRRFVPHSVIDSGTRRRAQWFRDEEHVFADHAVFVKDLVEAGGRAGVGSHGQLQGLGYHWELWAMAAGGIGELDALRMATILGAEAIGLDEDLGTIETGKLADLVILDANPLDDIRNTNRIAMVMMNGRLFDAETLAEQYPGDREVGPMWWWDDEPGALPGVGGN
ncbi:MAG: amidohydrolase family protein [Gemmatimonadota bacterium]|nr:amidohydrolase family protein [Gemmatimonadota bacterium]MDE2866466.1 amidohydrolase family protein [Gemmatimonadota bacterium]